MTKYDYRLAAIGIGCALSALRALEEAADRMNCEPFPDEMSDEIQDMADSLQSIINTANVILDSEEP